MFGLIKKKCLPCVSFNTIQSGMSSPHGLHNTIPKKLSLKILHILTNNKNKGKYKIKQKLNRKKHVKTIQYDYTITLLLNYIYIWVRVKGRNA